MDSAREIVRYHRPYIESTDNEIVSSIETFDHELRRARYRTPELDVMNSRLKLYIQELIYRS